MRYRIVRLSIHPRISLCEYRHLCIRTVLSKQFTMRYYHAHALLTLAALTLPPLVAFAPITWRVYASLAASALFALIGIAYRAAFRSECRAAKDRGAESFWRFVQARKANHPEASATHQVDSETPQRSSARR